MQAPTTSLTFGVDVDGVLADFGSTFLDIANRVCGTSYATKDLTTWDFEDVPEFAANADRIWAEVGNEDFARSLPAYDGSVKAMASLKRLGEVHIITSPVWIAQPLMEAESTGEPPSAYGKTFCYDRARWLEEKYGISRKSVIFAYHKHLVDVDVFIDDKVSNVAQWITARSVRNPLAKAILWAHPYNREGEDLHPRVLRTNSWAKALRFIKEA